MGGALASWLFVVAIGAGPTGPMSIAGTWEVHHGDLTDPTVGEGWKPITLPADTRSMDLPAGVSWLRRTVSVPEPWRGEPLSVTLGPIIGAMDVYADGARVAGRGRTLLRPEAFRADLGPPHRAELSIAIRVVTEQPAKHINFPSGAVGRPDRYALAPSAMVENDLAAWRYEKFSTPHIALSLAKGVLLLAFAIVFLVLFTSRRSQRPALWFVVWALSEGLGTFVIILQHDLSLVIGFELMLALFFAQLVGAHIASSASRPTSPATCPPESQPGCSA